MHRYHKSRTQTQTSLQHQLPSDSHTSTSDPTSSHTRPDPPTSTNLVETLALVLVRTSSCLKRFAFVMQARHWGHGGWGSAWSQFPQIGMASLDWATRLVDAMDLYHSDTALGQGSPIGFPMLEYLCVDGTADVSPFVKLSPNLRTLRLRIPEGFNASDCKSIIRTALPCVPRLASLEMWVWELADTAEERVALLEEMAESCPDLRRLSFQTRTFDYADGGMALRPVSERRFDWKVS